MSPFLIAAIIQSSFVGAPAGTDLSDTPPALLKWARAWDPITALHVVWATQVDQPGAYADKRVACIVERIDLARDGHSHQIEFDFQRPTLFPADEFPWALDVWVTDHEHERNPYSRLETSAFKSWHIEGPPAGGVLYPADPNEALHLAWASKSPAMAAWPILDHPEKLRFEESADHELIVSEGDRSLYFITQGDDLVLQRAETHHPDDQPPTLTRWTFSDFRPEPGLPPIPHVARSEGPRLLRGPGNAMEFERDGPLVLWAEYRLSQASIQPFPQDLQSAIQARIAAGPSDNPFPTSPPPPNDWTPDGRPLTPLDHARTDLLIAGAAAILAGIAWRILKSRRA